MVAVPDSHAFALFALAAVALLVVPGPSVLYIVTPRRGGSLQRLFWQGALVNTLNPKTALFFLAFVPQFVDTSRTVWTQVVLFGLAFVALGFLSDGAYALAAGSVSGWIRRRRRVIRYASGSIFIGLGATAALAKRA